jgi:predicted permease
VPAWITNLRVVSRRLAMSPAFTVVALLTLAIGIGANTAVFSVIHGVLLKPLPYPDADRLVALRHTAPGVGIKKLPVSPSLYFTYREEGKVFEDVAIWNDQAVTVTGSGEPERVDGVESTYTVFPLLRAGPAAGRLFNAADDKPGTPETVVLSYGYWQRKFGRSATAIGRRLRIDGTEREIIGALPEDFRFMDARPELYLPMRIDRSKLTAGNFSFDGIARLKPGATLAMANADMARMLPVSMDKFPMPAGFTRSMFEAARIAPQLTPLKDDIVGDVKSLLWVLMASVGIILAIACANVANLFLARTEARRQELAMRSALGAGWGGIARQLLSESVGIGLLGGAAGLALAFGGVRLLVSLAPENLPRLDSISIDAVTLAFTLAISVLSGILFGLIPAIRLSRGDLAVTLKEGGRSAGAGRARHRTRSLLAAFQVALALILLVGAGLLLRTFQALRDVNPGFVHPKEVLTFRVPVPDVDSISPEQSARMHQRIVEGILAIPGVTGAAAASKITMSGGGTEHDPIFVEEFPTPEGQIPAIRTYKFITPGLFKTMGNPVVAGRDITWAEISERRPVVLVSANIARQFWKEPGRALGKRIRSSPKSAWREIVGVVAEERDDGASQPAPQIVYWPLLVDHMWQEEASTWRTLGYAVRSPRTGAPDFLTAIRGVVRAVDPSLPVTTVRTLEAVRERSMARTTFLLTMLGVASGIALALGLVGIYAVVSCSVSQRTREIGIRMAVGARHSAVRMHFVRQGLALAAIGVVCGIAAAAALTRTVASFLFGVRPLDPLTFAEVVALLVAATLAASYLPARRATAVDPARVLRSE